jgi:hypothetical protein
MPAGHVRAGILFLALIGFSRVRNFSSGNLNSMA